MIGIEYYRNLDVLSCEQLDELLHLWHLKTITCRKEALASQWMILLIFMLVGFAIYVAWMLGGFAVVFSSIIGVTAIIAMIEDKRVRTAKRNLADANRVYQHLSQHMESRLQE